MLLRSLLATKALVAGITGLAPTARAELAACAGFGTAHATGCVQGGGLTSAAPVLSAILPIAGDGYYFFGRGAAGAQCALLTNYPAAFFDKTFYPNRTYVTYDNDLPTAPGNNKGYPLSVNLVASEAALSADDST